MRMADPQFYSHLFPFADPTCLVHAQDLTDAEVVSMHHEDAVLEVIESDNEELPTTESFDPSQLSQQPTQLSSLGQCSESTDPLPAPCLLQSGSMKQHAPLQVPITTLSPVPSRPLRARTNRPGSIPLCGTST
eukprot:2473458-Rhodomonas_salina.1